MHIKKYVLAPALGAALMLSFGFAGAASALTASCTGTPSATNITWSASSSGGVAPVAFLWGNGTTTSTQVVAEPFGMYTMTLQATDASSSVATTTCAATIAQPAPTIGSFVATPASITVGQSSVLSWSVSNASTTSVNNGLGTISSTSITVTPSVTTTYTLSATNPGGTTTANATVTVNSTTSTSTGTGSGGATLAAQIAALLNQILALKAQIAQMLLQNMTGGGTATSTPACFNFNRDLRMGSEGDDVKALQQALAQDPTIFPRGLITGHFGPKTFAALKMFQRRFGIGATTSPTGFFGPMSRSFFKMNCGNHGDNDNEHHASSTEVTSSSTNPFTNWGHNEDKGKDKNKGKGGEGHDD